MMRNCYKYHLILLLLSLLNLWGCSNKPYGIRFDTIVYNFGEVEDGAEVHYAYKFTNTGTETLTILNVQPSCGCTTADNWDRTVLPGKKGKIPITLKTPRYNGELEKIINIKTNVPGQEVIQLSLKGKVIIPIDIVPFNTWLGEITKETKSLSGSFEIRNNTNRPLKITDIKPPDADITYSFTTVEKNRKFRLDYKINAPFSGIETVGKQFTLRTNNKKHEIIKPQFFYYVPPPLKVFPNKISVDTTRLARNNRFDIDIKSSLAEPIMIRDLQLNGGNGKGIRLTLKENVKGKYYQISVKFPLDFTISDDEKIFVGFRVENDPQKTVYSIPIMDSQKNL